MNETVKVSIEHGKPPRVAEKFCAETFYVEGGEWSFCEFHESEEDIAKTVASLEKQGLRYIVVRFTLPEIIA